jgi:hypothetical protein
MTNESWISELKVGDKVYCQSYGGSFHLGKVVSISAKRGDISVQYKENGPKQVFSSNGREKGDGYTREYLAPYNQETIDRIKAKNQRNENMAEIRDTAWQHISDDKLARIAAILKEGK